jgi:signal transduction histidine kinase
MRTSTFYRLIAGLVLVGVIFLAELYLPWGFFLYLIVPAILLTIPDEKKQVALGWITSVCLVAGYVWWIRETEIVPAELGNRVLLLSIVWLVIFFSTRIKKFSADEKGKSEFFDSLQQAKEAAVTRLSLIERELAAANKEKRLVEDELLKGKRLHDTLVQHYPDGVICVLNKEMKYVFANGRGLEAFGLTPPELTGNHAVIGSGDELTRAFNGESISFETTINHESYTVNAIPIPDVRNESNEILIIIRNITDRKKLENNLIKAIEKEKELSALKTQFVTMASHKFRTPLSTILSSVFLLENNTDADDQERKSYFEKIKRSVHHLTDLLNDFLSLGKLEEGKVRVAFSETNIKSFFQDFLQEIISLKKAKQKIQFTYDGLDCTVMTDQLLLKNILMSLLTNAIEYSSQEAEIELAVELKKDNLYIRVSDQGIGIPEEEQHQIFKRFYRGQNTSNVEGTGLGLNIAKKYIRLLKGTIEFKSQLNKGTTFITNIPVVTLDILEKQT